MISVECFACKGKISAPDQAAGRSGKCPKCGALLLIPSSEVQIQTSPCEVVKSGLAKSDSPLPKPKRRKFAKKESSPLPIYLTGGVVCLVVLFAVGLWIGVSFYI